MDLDWLISQFQVLPVFNWEVRYFAICWLDLTFYLNILYDVIYGYSLLSIPFTFNRSFGNFDTASVSAFKHSLCTFVPCKKILKLKVTHTHTHTHKHTYICYMYITVHHVPKCMSCHKAIVVITGRAHCFHDYIYVTLILFLWDLSTLCVVDHLWPLIIHIYIYICIYIYTKHMRGNLCGGVCLMKLQG